MTRFTAHRTFHFRDEDDNCTAILTSMMAGGGYRAIVTESDTDEMNFVVAGYGTTRLEAIANLNEVIKMRRNEMEDAQ